MVRYDSLFEGVDGVEHIHKAHWGCGDVFCWLYTNHSKDLKFTETARHPRGVQRAHRPGALRRWARCTYALRRFVFCAAARGKRREASAQARQQHRVAPPAGPRPRDGHQVVFQMTNMAIDGKSQDERKVVVALNPKMSEMLIIKQAGAPRPGPCSAPHPALARKPAQRTQPQPSRRVGPTWPALAFRVAPA